MGSASPGCTSTDYHTFRWPNIIATGRPTLYVCLIMYCPCRFSQPPTGLLVGRRHPYVCYHIYQSVHNALQCTQFCGPAGPSCMCCWPKFRWYHFHKGLYMSVEPLLRWSVTEGSGVGSPSSSRSEQSTSSTGCEPSSWAEGQTFGLRGDWRSRKPW